MAPGQKNKLGAPMFEPKVFRKQMCYWRKWLRHCWNFSTPSAVIRHPGNRAPLGPLRYATEVVIYGLK